MKSESRASLLLVDDRAANLLALEAILSPLGLRLVAAQSGDEALQHVLKHDFAAILLDVQMPGLDGFQTATLIKQRQKSRHIPIVFLTAVNQDAEYVWKGYEHGAVDYLLKPLDPAVLRAKVMVFVELWRRGEQLKLQEAELRRAAEEHLQRQSDLRYRSVIDSLPQCVWALRPDGKVYLWNRSWLRYSGLDGETMARTGIEGHIHEQDRARVAAEWKESFAGGTTRESELRLRSADGEYRWHLCRMLPERDEQGELLGFIATATDIDEVRRASLEAQAANRTKDEFLATVSHELRNPLNAILGWMRMLRSGRLDEGGRARALETIERNTEAQLALVEDILDVSRIITGKMRVSLKSVSLMRVISDAIDSVRPAIEQRELRLETIFDTGADQCSGDPDRLQQVVWNLLSNAIKFTPRGGRVEVRLERDGSHVQIRVSDSGRGIDSAFLPFVFERFRQAQAISTRTQGGLGLGLAIVRHVVEAHGGTVNVASAGDGQGATFVVRLPLRAVQSVPVDVEEAVTERRAIPSLAEAPMLDGLRVLVVDDEPDARELLEVVLGHSGAEVVAVGTAAEALAELRAREHDILVSDVGLPNEDGYSLITKVRALPSPAGQIPAAALTGFARAEDGHKALAAGFHAHVAKPVEPGLLVSLVAKLVGRGRRRAAAG